MSDPKRWVTMARVLRERRWTMELRWANGEMFTARLVSRDRDGEEHLMPPAAEGAILFGEGRTAVAALDELARRIHERYGEPA